MKIETLEVHEPRIPFQVSRAMACLDPLSRVGRLLLTHVIEESYPGGDMGGGEPVACPLNFTSLSREWRVARRNVSIQTRGLIVAKVLLRSDGPDGPRYLLNLDFQDWVDGGRVEPHHLDLIQNGFPASCHEASDEDDDL